jgi:hypothetical protein
MTLVTSLAIDLDGVGKDHFVESPQQTHVQNWSGSRRERIRVSSEGPRWLNRYEGFRQADTRRIATRALVRMLLAQSVRSVRSWA